jgi:acetylornithine deacetylase
MTEVKIAHGDAVALTRALVAVDSRNPVIAPGGPGEGAVASLLAGVLAGWGFDVELQEVAPGRPNVIARTGKRGGPALMFNGHLDVVGTEGMVHPPFDPAVRDGRIYGRGSADMKGGIAAMCAAAARAASATNAELVITAVIDEENESLGTRALVDSGVRADAAIVTEPTQLAIMPAHRGFVWLEIELRGRAAHGSRYDIGIDAITERAYSAGALGCKALGASGGGCVVVITGEDDTDAVRRAIGKLATPLDYAVDVEGFTVISDEGVADD